VAAGDADGCGEPADADCDADADGDADADADGDGDAEGCGVTSVGDGPSPDVVSTAVTRGREDSVLTRAPVRSRPALSMANHAVADTQATVTSQIIAMPTADRSFTTMCSPPCRHCLTFATTGHHTA